MNWDQVKGNWKQMTGQAREQWGKLTDDDLQEAAGLKRGGNHKPPGYEGAWDTFKKRKDDKDSKHGGSRR